MGVGARTGRECKNEGKGGGAGMVGEGPRMRREGKRDERGDSESGGGSFPE